MAESYFQSWQAEPMVDAPERFLARHPELIAAQLVEVLLVDQTLQWQRAPGPGVEQYLQRFPVVADQRDAVLELVHGEMRAARGLGRSVDVDAYVARFPDLAEPLRRQIEVSAWFAEEIGSTKPVDPPSANRRPKPP